VAVFFLRLFLAVMAGKNITERQSRSCRTKFSD
jgi:hypothetical protein